MTGRLPGLLLLACLGPPCLAAPGATPVADNAVGNTPNPVVQDDLGHRLFTLPHARRIVTLAPNDTELVLAAGAGRYLVAASSDGVRLPPGVEKFSTFGGLDRERLLALRPDLVIAWASGNRAGDLAWLRSLGIRVYETEPRRLSDIARALRDIGRLAGTEKIAARAARTFNRTLRNACDGKSPPRTVYVDIWDRPAMSVGGRHWLNDVLRHADMRNVYRHVDRGVFPVEAEARMAQPAGRIIHLDSHTRLARLLGRPGPKLAEAVARLCRQAAGRGAPASK